MDLGTILDVYLQGIWFISTRVLFRELRLDLPMHQYVLEKNCGVQMEDVAKVLTMRWELLVNVIRMLQLMGRDPAAHQRTGVVIQISIASVRDVSTTAVNSSNLRNQLLQLA